MNKVNYQLYTDEFVAREQQKPSGSPRSRLLLHACCAPCSSYVLEYLTAYFDITVFFSNPNITDPQEYKKRLDELCRLVRQAPFCSGVTVVGTILPPRNSSASRAVWSARPRAENAAGRALGCALKKARAMRRKTALIFLPPLLPSARIKMPQ